MSDVVRNYNDLPIEVLFEVASYLSIHDVTFGFRLINRLSYAVSIHERTWATFFFEPCCNAEFYHLAVKHPGVRCFSGRRMNASTMSPMDVYLHLPDLVEVHEWPLPKRPRIPVTLAPYIPEGANEPETQRYNAAVADGNPPPPPPPQHLEDLETNWRKEMVDFERVDSVLTRLRVYRNKSFKGYNVELLGDQVEILETGQNASPFMFSNLRELVCWHSFSSKGYNEEDDAVEFSNLQKVAFPFSTGTMSTAWDCLMTRAVNLTSLLLNLSFEVNDLRFNVLPTMLTRATLCGPGRHFNVNVVVPILTANPGITYLKIRRLDDVVATELSKKENLTALHVDIESVSPPARYLLEMMGETFQLSELGIKAARLSGDATSVTLANSLVTPRVLIGAVLHPKLIHILGERLSHLRVLVLSHDLYEDTNGPVPNAETAGITVADAEVFVEHAVNLKELTIDIDDCVAVDAYEVLAGACHRLTKLSLSVSDAECAVLVEAAADTVHHLNLGSGASVTNACLEALAAGVSGPRRLEFLSVAALTPRVMERLDDLSAAGVVLDNIWTNMALLSDGKRVLPSQPEFDDVTAAIADKVGVHPAAVLFGDRGTDGGGGAGGE